MIQAARITNWFSRQNGSASQRRSHGDLDSSMKTFDAFVQTDDDASRAVIAGAAFFCAPLSAVTLVRTAYKKAAEDAEIARKFAEDSGARLLQARAPSSGYLKNYSRIAATGAWPSRTITSRGPGSFSRSATQSVHIVGLPLL